jgi:CRP-like cAMP-binding protein
VLGKGAIFGEIALLDGNPRTADATAVTDCELFVIGAVIFCISNRNRSGKSGAEAQLELARIGREKQLLLEVLMSDVSSPYIQAIRRLDRYERKAKSRRKKALSRLSQLCQLPIFR